MSERTLGFRAAPYRGWNRLLYLLPERRQARALARLLLRTHWKDMDPARAEGPIYFALPDGATYRLIDREGTVSPASLRDVPMIPGV